jgi:hypothetical protein
MNHNVMKPNPQPLPTPLVLPYFGRWQRTKPFFSLKGGHSKPLSAKKVIRFPLKSRRGLGRGGERFTREVYVWSIQALP